MSEWLPIETAPKDAQPNIAYCPRGARWSEDIEIVWWNGNDWWKFDGVDLGYEPTHWQPLPEPPTPPQPA